MELWEIQQCTAANQKSIWPPAINTSNFHLTKSNLLPDWIYEIDQINKEFTPLMILRVLWWTVWKEWHTHCAPPNTTIEMSSTTGSARRWTWGSRTFTSTAASIWPTPCCPRGGSPGLSNRIRCAAGTIPDSQLCEAYWDAAWPWRRSSSSSLHRARQGRSSSWSGTRFGPLTRKALTTLRHATPPYWEIQMLLLT